jgi:hypothetical protein
VASLGTTKLRDEGTTWAARTLAQARTAAFGEVAISVQLLRREDLGEDKLTLNPRTFLIGNALDILASFNPDRMTKIHVAVEPLGPQAKQYLSNPIAKKNLAHVLAVLVDRWGNLKPGIDSTTNISYKTLQQLCNVPSSEPLTKECLARHGLLQADGTLPEDLLLHPITGNHSSQAARWYLDRVSKKRHDFRSSVCHFQI